jgi:hypothetical protein
MNMSVLSSSKHEHFAQLVAKGVSPIDAYVQAGYAKSGARQSAHRLLHGADISRRIKELRRQISEGVVAKVVLDRTQRIAILEERVRRKLALSDARAVMYAHELGEDRTLLVANAAEEKLRRAEGFGDPPAEVLLSLKYKRLPPAEGAVVPEFPKLLHHPGYPIGGATGLLVKDYRGKNAEQVIWKMDTGTESSIRDDLKQIAIEEGTWNEKREPTPAERPPTTYNILFVAAPPRDANGRLILTPATTQK